MKKTALFLALVFLTVPAWAKKFNPTNYPQTATICTFSGYNSTDKQAYSIANAVCIDSTGGVVFNEGAAAVDFRIEGDTEANLFFVDASADSIGIGTSAPVLSGSTTIGIDIVGGVSAEIHLHDTDSGTTSSDGANFTLQDSDLFIHNRESGTIRFNISGSELARFESDGDFCVGATSCSSPLSVTGNIAVTGTVDGVDIAARDHAATTDTNANTICSGTSVYLDGEGNCDTLTLSGITGAGTSGKIVKYTGSTTVADSVIEESSSKIGIGVTPVTDLHVQESTTDTVPTVEFEQLSTGDAGLQFSIAGDSYVLGIDNSESDQFKISYASTAGTAVLGINDRFVIDSSGDVGIGTAAQQTKLHILEITSDTVPSLEIEQGSTGDAAIQFSIVGDAYAVGIDNSDNDLFKISYASATGTAVLGTGDVLTLDSGGALTVVDILTITAKASAPGTCSIGDFYVDTSGAACACSASNTWSNMHATGTCS